MTHIPTINHDFDYIGEHHIQADIDDLILVLTIDYNEKVSHSQGDYYTPAYTEIDPQYNIKKAILINEDSEEIKLTTSEYKELQNKIENGEVFR